ncbi:MAG: CheY-like chemotaxis protein [Paracoccaceae bacterium]|jgi:CheY-like chemotaxis protein
MFMLIIEAKVLKAMSAHRILIVDDNEDIRELVSNLLAGEGYQPVMYL